MTPVPLDLPLRPPEAAEVASLVFEVAERQPLGDEIRNRIAARAAAWKLESIAPWFGSLARDPLHHSMYYLAVDVVQGPPQLLHMAPAAVRQHSLHRGTRRYAPRMTRKMDLWSPRCSCLPRSSTTCGL